MSSDFQFISLRNHNSRPQIDLSVLRELPPDIRQQVEKDMAIGRRHGNHGHRHSTNQQESTISGDSYSANEHCSSIHGKELIAEVPGCSHWSSQENKRRDDVEVKDVAIVPLPSPSQVGISPGVVVTGRSRNSVQTSLI